MPDNKTFKIITLGCKVNQYESDVMRAVCIGAGYAHADGERAADLVVVNTCAVTARAAAKSRRAVRAALRYSPGAKIIAAGCAVEADRAAFEKLGVGVCLLEQSRKEAFPQLLGMDDAYLPAPERTRAFLKVQDGCDRFCSYCIIPYVRKLLWSKPAGRAIAEAEYLASLGHREIVLTGVRLGMYDGGAGVDLGALLGRLDGLRGPERIRLSSLEPWEVGPGLLEAAAASEKFCRHLHIPLQSGDDGILRAMNRPYTSGEFLAIIRNAGRVLPGVAITTDVIVGYPGESDVQFENTLRVCREARFSKIHVFPYSPRPGTAAAAQCRPGGADVEKRLGRVRALEEELGLSFRQGLVGGNVEVLIENNCAPPTGLSCGTSREYVKVFIERERAGANSIVNARVIRADARHAYAKIVYDSKA